MQNLNILVFYQIVIDTLDILASAVEANDYFSIDWFTVYIIRITVFPFKDICY